MRFGQRNSWAWEQVTLGPDIFGELFLKDGHLIHVSSVTFFTCLFESVSIDSSQILSLRDPHRTFIKPTGCQYTLVSSVRTREVKEAFEATPCISTGSSCSNASRYFINVHVFYLKRLPISYLTIHIISDEK